MDMDKATLDIVYSLLVAGTTVLVAALALSLLLYAIRRANASRLRRDAERRLLSLEGKFIHEVKPTLPQRLEMVRSLSQQLSEWNREINLEFELQQAEVARLQAKAQEAQEIAALNDQALKAAESLVAAQLEKALDKNSRTDRRFQIAVAAISFVFGVAATLVIQALTGSG